MTELILLGGGGHARSVLAALAQASIAVRGYLAPAPGPLSAHLAHLGDDDALTDFDPAQTQVVSGLGSAGSTRRRRELFERVSGTGFRFASVMHPRSFVDPAAQLGEGVHVLAGAVVNAGAIVGDDVIINSGAIVEHDAVIGSHSHITPGAVIAGAVRLGDGVHLGLGARVIQGIRIGSESIVGAGAVVIRDVEANSTVVGVPARLLSAQAQGEEHP